MFGDLLSSNSCLTLGFKYCILLTVKLVMFFVNKYSAYFCNFQSYTEIHHQFSSAVKYVVIMHMNVSLLLSNSFFISEDIFH